MQSHKYISAKNLKAPCNDVNLESLKLLTSIPGTNLLWSMASRVCIHFDEITLPCITLWKMIKLSKSCIVLECLCMILLYVLMPSYAFCPSVFLRNGNGHKFFMIFYTMTNNLNIYKPFFQETSLLPKFGQKGSKIALK